MNVLAAGAATQPIQGYQNPQQMQGYQTTTVQPDKPVPRPSTTARVIYTLNLLFSLAVIIFFVVMTYRFVRATEKVADSVKDVFVRKEDSTTESQT